jgi:hypothetical protein
MRIITTDTAIRIILPMKFIGVCPFSILGPSHPNFYHSFAPSLLRLNSSGGLAMLAANLRPSSFVSSLAADRRPGSSSY